MSSHSEITWLVNMYIKPGRNAQITKIHKHPIQLHKAIRDEQNAANFELLPSYCSMSRVAALDCYLPRYAALDCIYTVRCFPRSRVASLDTVYVKSCFPWYCIHQELLPFTVHTSRVASLDCKWGIKYWENHISMITFEAYDTTVGLTVITVSTMATLYMDL